MSGETKTIRQYLVVDHVKDRMRARKSKPSSSELGTNEVIVEAKVEVNTRPEPDIPTIAAEVNVSETQVYTATLEALEPEDLPDWTDEAEAVVEEELSGTEDLTTEEQEAVVDELTTKTMLQTNTRPKTERVRRHVDGLVGTKLGTSEEDTSAR